MIPYSVIKEVNPDRVKRQRDGCNEFSDVQRHRGARACLCSYLRKDTSTSMDHATHLRHTFFFWIVVIVIAMLATLGLKETGAAARTATDELCPIASA